MPPECTCSFYREVTEKSSHFATFPTALVKPCILAGTSAAGVCATCGAPRRRVVEKGERIQQHWAPGTQKKADLAQGPHGSTSVLNTGHTFAKNTLGWEPSCNCSAPSIPATVLDPFAGSGTTGAVAVNLGRAFVGVELKPEYCELARRRILGANPALPLFGE